MPSPPSTRGEAKVWLTAAGLALGLLMVTGLLGLIVWNGAAVFWPHRVTEVSLQDGTRFAGVRVKQQNRQDLLTGEVVSEVQFFTGNRDRYGLAFRFIDARDIRDRKQPSGYAVLERLEHGKAIVLPDHVQGADGAVLNATDNGFAKRLSELLKQPENRAVLHYHLPTGESGELPLADLVRLHFPNDMTGWQRLRHFASQFWTFVSTPPREANMEGGIFPAIFGTFVMTLLMAALVTPLGIIAAIYLHEYAKHGLLLQTVRVCVNNLAGVPSIVFGVFGLGFFVYGLGGFIDAGPSAPLPAPWWFAAALGAVLSLFGALLISSINRAPALSRPGRRRLLFSETALWGSAAVLAILSLAKCPYFHGFFSHKLPNPTFGTGGILWASLTLALMTLPVVIVATEEALAAVPRGVREAALACGASKWQMIQRIALPGALPGVMTGIILAMARGAGEVAPLMITGVVKLAPSLPIDTAAPFIHAERKFMHLGFHIYDLGFQSPDSEAAKPMVFATTLLLIALVVVLNLAAIQIRSHLLRKYQAAAF